MPSAASFVPADRPDIVAGAAGPLRPALLLLLLLLAPACGDVGVAVIGAAPRGQTILHSGLYTYRAWSDFSARGPVWSGFLELQIEAGGQVSGFYRLPRQCSDAFGLEADCVGRVGGRIHRDGSIRFGLDEGWLQHEGWIDRGSRVTGRWETRILGYRDFGTFELLPADW